MNKLQPIYAVLFTLFLLYAFSSNPSNSNTGAPGDSNCTSCHGNPNNSFDGAVSIKGLPDDIVPGTTYKLSVVTKVTAGNPMRAGFQMVVLDGAANNAGNLMNPSNSSTVTLANGRNYFEHNPALFFNGIDSVAWSVDWTAPNTIGSDSIEIYINSILGNGSGSSNDLMVSSQTAYNFQTITADPILVNIVSSAISCFGETDGLATVIASGGSGNFTYQWSNDSTTTTIDSLGIGSYVVTVTDSDGASESASIIITQPDEIQIALDNVVNVSCTTPMGQATVTTTGGGAPYSYLWSTNNDFITNPTETLPSGTHSVTVVDVNNCSSVATVAIEEDIRAPVVFAGFDVMLTCDDTSSTTQLEAFNTTTGTGVTYLWTTTDGNVVSGETSLTPIVDASGTYVLTVTLGTNGCFASDSTVVSINKEIPIANAGMDQKIDCQNALAILDGSASSQDENLNYNWTSPDGSIVSIENPLNPTVSSAGTYILTVTNLLTGCTAMDEVIVTQDTQMPTVNITPSNLLDCFNSTVTLNGSTTMTENFTYSWTTTDGNILIGNNTLAAVVDAAGTYTLTTTNTSNNCSSITATTVVNNRAAPTVGAGEIASLTCSNTSLVLTGTGDTNPDITYNWTTTDGNIVSGATTLTPTINAAGTYTITATNPATGCTVATQVQVLVDTLLPTANAGNSQQLNCENSTVVLNGSTNSQGDNFAYNWATVDGVILSDANTLMPTVASAGTYTLTVTNTLTGCTAMASVSVTQDTQLPIISAGEAAVLTCSITSLVLTGTGDTSSSISYNWTTADGNIVSGATTLTPTINAAGTYTLTATNTLSGCSISDQVIILADMLLTSADAGSNQQIDCNNSTVVLNGSGTDGATYLWSTENGNILSGDSTLTPVVDAAGLYTLTVTNPISGCTNADVVEIIADVVKPMVEAGPAEQSFCDNTTLAINASGSVGENFTYFWCTEDGSILSGSEALDVVIDGGGLFEFIVTNTSNGCKNADTVIVTALESPMLFLENDTSLTVTGGTLPYSFTATMDGNTTDIGSLDNLLPGEYVVTITDANGCMNEIQFTIEMSTSFSALDEQIESLALFPNPTSDYLTVNIDFNHTQTGSIFIRNKIGQQVWQQSFSDKNINLEIDVMDWSTGIYYMMIQTDEGVKTAEIVVTK